MNEREGRIVPNPRCLLTELGDGTGVLLHLDTKFYYTLNRTGLVLWKAAASAPAKRAEDIAADFATRFEVDVSTARKDVDAVLDELVGEDMITFARP